MSEKVYVVYWVDLDNDCLKKSEIEIIGVFTNEEIAENMAGEITSTREGYSADRRCHYAKVVERVIDQ